jgi:hypothetical protein
MTQQLIRSISDLSRTAIPIDQLSTRMRILLNSSLDLNLTIKDERSIANTVYTLCDASILDYYLRLCPRIVNNPDSCGYTLVHCAINLDHDVKAKMLIENHHADVNVCNAQGFSVLDSAYHTGNTLLLLKHTNASTMIGLHQWILYPWIAKRDSSKLKRRAFYVAIFSSIPNLPDELKRIWIEMIG